MKILIGTPIHQVKDYAMERWLQNVVKLQLEYSADVLLVDNSPGLEYVEKVKGYCATYGVKNYKIEHLEISQKLRSDLRIEASQEMIRRYILSHNYDAWFSWECDQIIPTDSLGKLIRIMEAGDFMMVLAHCLSRLDPMLDSTDMGCTLIKRTCLEKSDFLPEQHCDGMDMMFKQRVLREGGNYVELHGIIEPLYHLDK